MDESLRKKKRQVATLPFVKGAMKRCDGEIMHQSLVYKEMVLLGLDQDGKITEQMVASCLGSAARADRHGITSHANGNFSYRAAEDKKPTRGGVPKVIERLDGQLKPGDLMEVVGTLGGRVVAKTATGSLYYVEKG